MRELLVRPEIIYPARPVTSYAVGLKYLIVCGIVYDPDMVAQL